MSEASSPKTMAPVDTELILKAREGDMMAFEELVYRYDKQVLSMAASYVSTSEDAKDIYQEVFLRVFRGLKRFELRSEFSTWLYRITTNVCLSHRARRKRHAHASIHDGESDDEAHGVPDDVRPDRQALGSEISDRVRQSLAKLSPQQRMVFTLRHYEGYKIREIAVMMNCADGTVKKYLFTATRRLREELNDLYE